MCAICDLAPAGRRDKPRLRSKESSETGFPSQGKSATRSRRPHAMPKGVGDEGRRTLIKGGTILSMDEGSAITRWATC